MEELRVVVLGVVVAWENGRVARDELLLADCSHAVRLRALAARLAGLHCALRRARNHDRLRGLLLSWAPASVIPFDLELLAGEHLAMPLVLQS